MNAVHFLTPTLAGLCLSVSLAAQSSLLVLEDGIVQDSQPSATAAYGFDVDVDGDVAIVGTLGEGARVMRRSTAGGWIEEARLTLPTSEISDRYGRTVAITGDTAFVADPGYHQPSSGGVVRVFERDPTAGWSYRSLLTGSDTISRDEFGHALDIEEGDQHRSEGEPDRAGRLLLQPAAGQGPCLRVRNRVERDRDPRASEPIGGQSLRRCCDPGPGVARHQRTVRRVRHGRRHGLGLDGRSPGRNLGRGRARPDSGALRQWNPLRGGGALYRMPVEVASGGVLRPSLDITAPHAVGQLDPGSTRNFQAWFRDTAAGGSGWNLSTAAALPFTP